MLRSDLPARMQRAEDIATMTMFGSAVAAYWTGCAYLVIPSVLSGLVAGTLYLGSLLVGRPRVPRKGSS